MVFTQSFNSADPGALNVVGALAAFSGTAGESVAASNFTAGASPQKAFALDQVRPDLHIASIKFVASMHTYFGSCMVGGVVNVVLQHRAASGYRGSLYDA